PSFRCDLSHAFIGIFGVFQVVRVTCKAMKQLYRIASLSLCNVDQFFSVTVRPNEALRLFAEQPHRNHEGIWRSSITFRALDVLHLRRTKTLPPKCRSDVLGSFRIPLIDPINCLEKPVSRPIDLWLPEYVFGLRQFCDRILYVFFLKQDHALIAAR